MYKTSNLIIAECNHYYRYPYGNTRGALLDEKFFSGNKFLPIQFGKTYYVEHEGSLCQIRLVSIKFMPKTYDWQFVFDMAYDGTIHTYVWGRAASDSKPRYDNIYESVNAFRANDYVQYKLVTLLSLFNVLTNNRYCGTYSGNVGIRGFNYIDSYKWNGCKAVAQIPNLLMAMSQYFKITEDNIVVAEAKLPYQIVDLKDKMDFYPTIAECQQNHSISVCTFDDTDSEKHEEEKIKITIELTIEQKKILTEMGICVE